MNEQYKELIQKGEYFAAGLFYDMSASRTLRYSKAYELFFKNTKLPNYYRHN